MTISKAKIKSKAQMILENAVIQSSETLKTLYQIIGEETAQKLILIQIMQNDRALKEAAKESGK